MIQGRYQDLARDAAGRLIFDSGWSSNAIVDSAWPLVAGLLRNDPGLQGILFWAVGAGDPAWDGAHPAASPAVAQLREEVARQAVPREDMVYQNADHTPSDSPTKCLEIATTFSWPEPRTVREFGLFGGDASEERDSGYMINYVIHPRLDLEAGATLARRVRLTLRPDVSRAWLEVPSHWLGDAPVERLDGVGEAYAAALADAGVETVGALAGVEPTLIEVDLPPMKLVELRAKARLTLRTASELATVPALLDRTARQILVTPTATLAADAQASEAAVERLREQVGALQLTLDNRFLQQVTVGELAQPL